MKTHEIHNQINKRVHKYSTKVCGEVCASVPLSKHVLECHIRVRSETKHNEIRLTSFTNKLQASQLIITQKLSKEEIKIQT